jgi:Kef-type K+ transport system membrane component KefB/Trk K+ transport system NAD-binding subunit
MEQLFLEVAVIIIVATVLGYISRLLKQPLIPAYIITGLLIGPLGTGFISDTKMIATLSEIGIAFLLFVVGLELDLKRLRDIGLVASVGGTLQIFLLFSFGYLFAIILNVFSLVEAIYIGLIVAFSSTMVVVKLLSDKKTLDTLHGRIIIGILLMEDIFAILSLSLLGSMNSFSIGLLLLSLFKALAVIVGAVLLGRFVFPPVFRFAAHSQELLFLLSLSACFLFSLTAAYIGFSIAIGGFIAGVTLANLPYNLEIVSRIKPLRDFFITLFFVSLGMQLVLFDLGKIILPLTVLIAFIVLLKPLVIMVICSLFGYTKRTSFLTAISLTQISEFSLIIVAQGLLLHQVSSEIFSLALMLAVVTMSLTAYATKYENAVYSSLSKYLTVFEKIGESKELRIMEGKNVNEAEAYDVILIGYDRIGYSIAKTLRRMGRSWLVVDFNPDIVKRLSKENVHCIYGDIGDIEVLDRLNFRDVKIVISTIPYIRENLLLMKQVKKVNQRAAIFVTANKVDEALKLYDHGADYVILPHFLGGDHVAVILEEVTADINKLIATKLSHIEELKARKDLGHEHPMHHYKNEH